MKTNVFNDSELVSITGVFELISLGCYSRSHAQPTKNKVYDLRPLMLPWLPQKCSTPNVTVCLESQVNKHATFSFHTAWTDMSLVHFWNGFSRYSMNYYTVHPCSAAPLGVQCHFKFSILLPLTYFCLGFPLPAVSPQRCSDPVTPCNTWPLALWELDKGWQFKLILDLSRSMFERNGELQLYLFLLRKGEVVTVCCLRWPHWGKMQVGRAKV